MNVETAPLNDTSQPPNVSSFFDKVLDIAGKVEAVVGPVLPLLIPFVAAADDETQIRVTGPVEWLLRQEDGKPTIKLKNTGPNDISVVFTGSKANGEHKQRLHPLGAAGSTTAESDATDDILGLANQGYVSPYVAITTADLDRVGAPMADLRAVSATLGSLNLGATIPVPGGSFTVGRHEDGSYFMTVAGEIFNLNYSIRVGTATLTGNSSASATTGAGKDDNSFAPAFPLEEANYVHLSYLVPSTVWNQAGHTAQVKRTNA